MVNGQCQCVKCLANGSACWDRARRRHHSVPSRSLCCPRKKSILLRKFFDVAWQGQQPFLCATWLTNVCECHRMPKLMLFMKRYANKIDVVYMYYERETYNPLDPLGFSSVSFIAGVQTSRWSELWLWQDRVPVEAASHEGRAAVNPFHWCLGFGCVNSVEVRCVSWFSWVQEKRLLCDQLSQMFYSSSKKPLCPWTSWLQQADQSQLSVRYTCCPELVETSSTSVSAEHTHQKYSIV